MSESKADSAGGTHAAFFYGTLMAPEIFFTVCYRGAIEDVSLLRNLHKFQPAILHGYCRRRVQWADYPGITPDPEHEVRGTYVTGLTDANMGHLDHFEGREYDREKVKVRLLTKAGDGKGHGNIEGDEVECEVYVYNNPKELEDREWDYEEFRTQKMKKWTREDFGFDDTNDIVPQEVEGGEKRAAVLGVISRSLALSVFRKNADYPHGSSEGECPASFGVYEMKL